jgi:hypothetical protein
MPTIVRAEVPLELLNELAALSDRLPGDTPRHRAALLVALAESLEAALLAGAPYVPLGDRPNPN